MRLRPGDMAPTFDTAALDGAPVRLPDPAARLTHVQFRRFAGCPVCNFHLRGFARRHAEIAAAGIREVAVFHASAAEMAKYQAGLPFACIADPTKALYRRYSVETSRWAPVHWRVLWSGGRNFLATRRLYTRAENGIFGLPADFLIDTAGHIVACHYGRHADDQWEIDHLLRLASAGGATAGAAT